MASPGRAAPEAVRRTPGAIRRMFEAVAPGYDRLNRLLSLGLDRGWRKQAVADLDSRPGDRVLDLCSGTGDLALLLPDSASVVACDFTPAMLEIAGRKASGRGVSLPRAAGDALRLPFRSGSFRRVVVGFGARNFADRAEAFREVRRVLAPGGRLVVLEFSRPPRRVFRFGHRLWLRFAVPGLAGVAAAASGGAAPYRYLRDSIFDFPDPEEVAGRLAAGGFDPVRFRYLSLGTVALHTADLPDRRFPPRPAAASRPGAEPPAATRGV